MKEGWMSFKKGVSYFLANKKDPHSISREANMLDRLKKIRMFDELEDLILKQSSPIFFHQNNLEVLQSTLLLYEG